MRYSFPQAQLKGDFAQTAESGNCERKGIRLKSLRAAAFVLPLNGFSHSVPEMSAKFRLKGVIPMKILRWSAIQPSVNSNTVSESASGRLIFQICILRIENIIVAQASVYTQP